VRVRGFECVFAWVHVRVCARVVGTFVTNVYMPMPLNVCMGCHAALLGHDFQSCLPKRSPGHSHQTHFVVTHIHSTSGVFRSPFFS
jgi:hypothetical protein